MSENAEARERCANCGAEMKGPFCAVCGQSEKDIRLPILTLASEAADGLLSWDGRMLSTLRALYMRPGQVARDYCDGKRVAHTAPVRLYLLISLFFFAAMALAGVRVIAIQLSPTEETVRAQDVEVIEQRRNILAEARAAALARAEESGTDGPETVGRLMAECGAEPGPDEIGPDGELVFARDTNLVITLFQHGEAPSPRRMTTEMRNCFARDVQATGLTERFGDVAIMALTEPAAFEQRASAAAGQALILMVGAFILMNMALHPRRRVIEHVVHALYFHAASLPALALPIILARFVDGTLAGQIALVAVSGLFNIWLIWAYDRGFYRSSWWGGVLRVIPLVMGYVLAVGFISIGIMFLSTL
jgi:hypothetical protein